MAKQEVCSPVRRHFKRIYVEITSCCNLHCSFCQETLREPVFLTPDRFEHILQEIRPYTRYIYLHVKGEPLLHPRLEEILSLCRSYDMTVNLTTNGTLLGERLETLIRYPVHVLNVSFHSADDNDCIDISKYAPDVFASCEKLLCATDTEISIRLWTTVSTSDMTAVSTSDTALSDTISAIAPTDTAYIAPARQPLLLGERNLRIKDRLHINVQSPFVWPDIHSDYYNNRGFCQGLRTHIAILSTGEVVPCCLDGNGVMSLGNIFEESLSSILATPRAETFVCEFGAKRTAEELCAHCSYKERFNHKLS